jgi:hypothetical protein
MVQPFPYKCETPNESRGMESEVLIVVTMKCTIFWNMTPFSLVNVYWRSSEASVNLH